MKGVREKGEGKVDEQKGGRGEERWDEDGEGKWKGISAKGM